MHRCSHIIFKHVPAGKYISVVAGAVELKLLQKIEDTLAKVDLTIYDVIEMIIDSGITGEDIVEVYDYIKGSDASSAGETNMFSEDVEVPVYLLRLYEQILANWFMLAGVDVQYDLWGW